MSFSWQTSNRCVKFLWIPCTPNINKIGSFSLSTYARSDSEAFRGTQSNATSRWCRFLTAPGCIKRGTRGAKRGVPHKRRHQPLPLPATSVAAANTLSPVTSPLTAVTSPPTVTSPVTCSSLTADSHDVKFAVHGLMMHATAPANCLTPYSSIASPPTTDDVTDDVTHASMPPLHRTCLSPAAGHPLPSPSHSANDWRG